MGLAFALSRTGTGQSGWATVLSSAIESWTWGSLAPLIIALDKRLPFYGKQPVLHLVTHVVLGPLWLLVFSFASESICWILGLQQWGHLFANYRQAFFWTMLIYLLIVGVSEADLFRQKHLSAELHVQRLGANLAHARLQTLRTQLHPHFLFNALNTISAEMEDDPRLARRMMEHLGDLLRASLESSERQEVTLGQELDLLNHFVAIQKARFEDDLTVAVHVPSELRSALVPSLLLQPLVENAVRHGVAPRVGGGAITITAKTEQEYVLLCIEDDGIGLPKNWTMSDATGIGLSSTSERIRGLYPDTGAGLSVRRRQPHGTSVHVLVPLRMKESKM